MGVPYRRLERRGRRAAPSSRAALETLAIIAYHPPVTCQLEEIRGVSTSKGTLDVLLENWLDQVRGRAPHPGVP